MTPPNTLIAMGLLTVAVLCGLALRGAEDLDPGAGHIFVAAETAAAAAGPPVGRLCGATTDALRCRSSD